MNVDAFQSQLDELRRQQQFLETEMERYEDNHQDRIRTIAQVYGMGEEDATAAEGALQGHSDEEEEFGLKKGPVRTTGSRAVTLRKYFDAMTDFPDYAQRREERLRDIRPFSFELTRTAS